MGQMIRRASTIGDNVYQILRKNIINLNLIPGQAMNIKDITEELRVSRSPVRDALIRLTEEGLVDTMPQKGTAVSRIDLNRVDNEQFIRHSLEEKALLLCLKRDMSPFMDRLRHAVAKQKECVHTDRYRDFLDYDDGFHAIFFEAADKSFSWYAIQNILGHYRRIRLMSLWDTEITENVCIQHEALLACLERQDRDGLVEMLYAHCYKLWKEEENLLKLYPDYFKRDNEQEEDGKHFLQYNFLRMIQ